MKQKKIIMRKAFNLKSPNFFIITGRVIFLVSLCAPFCFPTPLTAAEDEVRTKKATTQSVGGLLFDVDEGVKVEQGAGGSVYVKSNREYMQEKFSELDRKLQGLDQRVTELETHRNKTLVQEKTAKEESRQVLVG